jgi:NAD(P)-dependent dehydrogenase (short-subunit alcohol dehydrogenase family)
MRTGSSSREATSARSSLFPETALVTGSAGGIGRAIVERLGREGAQVLELDLVTGFDVSDPTAWESVDRVELACLNAGIGTGTDSIRELTAEQFRRVVGVNVDGVVYGVRRLARVMDEGGAIVVTASLAGLTTMVLDPIYSGTKHFVVGFVRSVAPQLAERGIAINAVCPAMVDTPMLDPIRDQLATSQIEVLQPDQIADAVLTAARDGSTGEAWTCLPGRRPERFAFHRFFDSA